MAVAILPEFSGAYHGHAAKGPVASTQVLTRPRLRTSQRPAMALPARAAGPWHRAVSTLAHVLGFGLVALTLHEFFHLVVLQALGGEGFITFDWKLGFTHFTEPPSHPWIAQISEGFLTGASPLLVF